MKKSPGDKRRLRIASYNINGVTTRIEVLLRWLDGFGPDIVALQELKAPQERFPAEAIAERGYSSICRRARYSSRSRWRRWWPRRWWRCSSRT